MDFSDTTLFDLCMVIFPVNICPILPIVLISGMAGATRCAPQIYDITKTVQSIFIWDVVCVNMYMYSSMYPSKVLVVGCKHVQIACTLVRSLW